MTAKLQVEEPPGLFDILRQQRSEFFLQSPVLGEFLFEPLQQRQGLVRLPLDDLGESLAGCPADQRFGGQPLAVEPRIHRL